MPTYKPTPNITALLAALSVNACTNETPLQADDNLIVALPPGLSSRSNINLDNLTATVRLLDTEFESTLYVGTEVATSRLPDIPYGDYTLQLDFVLQDPNDNSSIPLVTATRPLQVTNTKTNATFFEGDFVYSDNDDDGYSNLAELNADTGLNDKNATPDTALAFVTTASGSGNLSEWALADNLSGLAAGDRICSNSATAAGLDGEFKAWLSDSNTDAVCRFNGLSGLFYKNNCDTSETVENNLGPWMQTNGTLFSESIAPLIENDVVFYPLQSDEFGNKPDAYTFAWTGTEPDGNGNWSDYPSENCANWTSRDDSDSGLIGSSDTTIGQWTSNHDQSCDGEAHLICLQTDTTDPLPIDHTVGKKAFITSASGTGDLSSWALSDTKTGLAAADTICQNSAKNAGISNHNKFVAWISSPEADAIDRLQGEGPWVRLDGVKFVDTKRQLLETPLTALNLDEVGEYKWELVLTGTQSSTGRVITGYTCDTWSSAESTDEGYFGSSTTVNSYWTELDDNYKNGCSYDDYRLYCFEQD